MRKKNTDTSKPSTTATKWQKLTYLELCKLIISCPANASCRVGDEDCTAIPILKFKTPNFIKALETYEQPDSPISLIYQAIDDCDCHVHLAIALVQDDNLSGARLVIPNNGHLNEFIANLNEFVRSFAGSNISQASSNAQAPKAANDKSNDTAKMSDTKSESQKPPKSQSTKASSTKASSAKRNRSTSQADLDRLVVRLQQCADKLAAYGDVVVIDVNKNRISHTSPDRTGKLRTKTKPLSEATLTALQGRLHYCSRRQQKNSVQAVTSAESDDSALDQTTLSEKANLQEATKQTSEGTNTPKHLDQSSAEADVPETPEQPPKDNVALGALEPSLDTANADASWQEYRQHKEVAV